MIFSWLRKKTKKKLLKESERIDDLKPHIEDIIRQNANPESQSQRITEYVKKIVQREIDRIF